MTRVLVESRLPLIDWLRVQATFAEWITALDSVAADSLLVAGGSEKLRKTLFANLESLGPDHASALIERYQRLPRTSGESVSADVSLSAQKDENHAGALTALRASDAFRDIREIRRQNPTEQEDVLSAFDRILFPLVKAATSITVVDAYAVAELLKPNSPASTIVNQRFGQVTGPITIHSVSPKQLSSNVPSSSSPNESARLPDSVTLVEHHKEIGSRDNRVSFPHARVWEFCFSQGKVVVNLDKGFDTFDSKSTGVVTESFDAEGWKRISQELLVTAIRHR